MAIIPKVAFLALVLGFAVGCEETLDPPTPTAKQEGGGIPLDMTPNTRNSTLGGAMRAAERTEDKISDYQERLNRQMEGDE